MPKPPPTIFRPATAAPRVRGRERRPNSAARGYGHRWQKVAHLHLEQHPLCADCAARGVTTLATLVDHIVAVRSESDPGFWSADNHQGLCRRCHAVKTHADRRAGRTRKDGR